MAAVMASSSRMPGWNAGGVGLGRDRAFTFLSATNDIATDGYTIELLDKREYGLANGVRIGFYRVGMLVAGVVLMVSGGFGWAWAYALGAWFSCSMPAWRCSRRAEKARDPAARRHRGGRMALLREQPN